MGKWKGKRRRKVGESVNIKKISECQKKIIGKLGKKKKDNDVDDDVT